MSASINLNPAAHHHVFAHTNTSFATEDFNLPSADKHPMFYVGVFAAIGIGSGLVLLLTLIVQYVAALRASKKMFQQLLNTVVHATMRWFDTTPQGRLLNRFSKVREITNLLPHPSLADFSSGHRNGRHFACRNLEFCQQLLGYFLLFSSGCHVRA